MHTVVSRHQITPKFIKIWLLRKTLHMIDGITPIKLSILCASEFDHKFVEAEFEICCPEISQKIPEMWEIMSSIASFMNEVRWIAVWLLEWKWALSVEIYNTRFRMTNYPIFSIVTTVFYWLCTRWGITVREVTLGLYSLRRRRLISIGIPIINLRRSSDRFRFIMGIPIPVRRRLLSE